MSALASATSQPATPVATEVAPVPAATLESVISGLEPDPDPERASDASTEETAPEAESKETEKLAEKPVDKPAQGKEDPFSDAALSTKEGILRAKDEVRALRQKHDSAYLKVKEREDKFARNLSTFKAEKAEFDTERNNFQAAKLALRRGTAAQATAAIEQLFGRDAVKVIEELNLTLARNGKHPEPSQEVTELKNELAELKRAMHGDAVERETRSQQAFIERRKNEIVQAAGNAELYPHLARFAPAKGAQISKHVVEMMTAAYESGEPITDAQALAQIEQELAAELAQLSQPTKAEPALASGASQAEQKPVQAQRTPGRSLNPGLTTKVTSVREISDEERVEELGKDSDFLRSIGLPA